MRADGRSSGAAEPHPSHAHLDRALYDSTDYFCGIDIKQCIFWLIRGSVTVGTIPNSLLVNPLDPQARSFFLLFNLTLNALAIFIITVRQM